MTQLVRRASHMASLLCVALLLQHCAGNDQRSMKTYPRQDLDGLEVIRWTTTQDTSKLEGIVVGFQKRPVMNMMATELLLKEGFLASIVDQSDMDLLREKLGSGSMDIRTSYGTLPSWREVFKRTIPMGQALTANGHGRTTANQVLQIAARGWTTPTESGACFQIEIATSILDIQTLQDEALGRADRPLGTPIDNTGIETCLQPNEVLIVLSANQGPFKSGRGPGSESPLPPTAGQFLLGESSDLQGKETLVKGVTLLAFVPHISSSILPSKSTTEKPSVNAMPAVNP